MSALSALALALVFAGQQEPKLTVEEQPMTPLELLEFGPLEDRAVISARVRAEYPLPQPAGAVREGGLKPSTLGLELAQPEPYEQGVDLTVRAEAGPEDRVAQVWLFVRFEGDAAYSRRPMEKVSGTSYAVTLGSAQTGGRSLRLYARADADDGSKPVLSGGPEAPFYVYAKDPPLQAVPSIWLLAVPGVALAAWRIRVSRMQKYAPPRLQLLSAIPARPQEASQKAATAAQGSVKACRRHP